MSTLERWALLFSHLVVAMVAAFVYGGWRDARHSAEVANLKRDQATAIAAERTADVVSLEAAKSHADELTLLLQQTGITLAKKETELRNAIASKTTGRACLSGDVVRLLNNAATDNATGVPAPTASAAAADGAAATDTDVAQWANLARTQYDICRARLNALIDW